ncbi:MAG: GTP-binding protein [Myxococcales bacterium]|nr:GTP-binding protein [Myxococcota bacterium]MDW8280090.1 GTP-binding protein [Myxococcales bacterium]
MERIGVTVVAGFLGSGKTTLLRRIVRDPEVGPGAAVIVNELGALGLDEELIQAEMQTRTLHLQQLASGCICCTLRGDLVDALRELARGSAGPPPTHVFIETSGAARASEVSYAVNAVGFDEPVQTDAVVTLVDGWNAGRARREHRELFEDQVRTADIVLLNKADLQPNPAARAALLDELRPLAPRATWLWTERSAIDPKLLVGHVSLDHPMPPQPAPAASSQGDTHGFMALTLPVPGPLDREALEEALEGLADTVFRIKGVVEVVEPGQPAAPLLVQAVGDRIELDPIAGAALERSPRRLIFIGAALDRARLEAAIAAAAGRA